MKSHIFHSLGTVIIAINVLSHLTLMTTLNLERKIFVPIIVIIVSHALNANLIFRTEFSTLLYNSIISIK